MVRLRLDRSTWLTGAVAVLALLLVLAWGLAAVRWALGGSMGATVPAGAEGFATAVSNDVPSSPADAYNTVIRKYPESLHSLYTETDETLRNTHQTSLTTGVLTLILNNTYVMRNYKLPVNTTPGDLLKLPGVAKLVAAGMTNAAYTVNPLTSALLDCTHLEGSGGSWGYVAYASGYPYNTGCTAGRLRTHPTSCRCAYKSSTNKPVYAPELFLLGSSHQDPALALFINVVTRLSSKYASSYTLYKFRNACMQDYYQYRQYTNRTDAFDVDADDRADFLALSEEQKLLMPQTTQTFESAVTELVTKMGLDANQVKADYDQIQTIHDERQAFAVRYDLDRAGGVLQTSRAMLMPLTQVQNLTDYSPTNLYPEHDGVYSVGPSSDDLAFELSVAAKHSTTVTRLSYNASDSLSTALANNQYAGRNAAPDKKFMRKWFVAFCMMAPYMTSDDANEGPSVAEMQFTIRQLVRAMGGYSRLDVPATDATGAVTDTNYDYVKTMGFTTASGDGQYAPDADREQSVLAVANAALYGGDTATQLKQTEWPLTVMAGTSANNQKRLTVRIPWAVDVFGVVVSSTPAIVRSYDLALKAVPAVQSPQTPSVGRNQTPTASGTRGWTIEVTITKRQRDGRHGWHDAFPLYFGKNVRVLKADPLAYPKVLFRGYLPVADTLDVPNPLALPPTNFRLYPPVRTGFVKDQKDPQIISGVSDIGMLEWLPAYPSYKKTPSIVGMQAGQPLSDSNNVQREAYLKVDTNDVCVTSTASTVNLGANAPCVVNTFDRSLFNHRNAVLVLEPDGTERGLGAFFDWLLDRDAYACAQAERDELYQKHPNDAKYAPQLAALQQPSGVERDRIKGDSKYYDRTMRDRASQAVHVQQLTQAVKTLVLRLDEFDGDAFRTLAPTPSDNDWLYAKETAATPEMFAAAETARKDYPKHIATLFRMHEALRVLLTTYVIVGIVSPCVASDNVRSFQTTSMPLTDADIYRYTTRSYGESSYPPEPREGETADEAKATAEPPAQFTTYASLVLTLRRKADLPKGMYTGTRNRLDTVVPVTTNPQIPSYYDLVDPYMLHTVLNMDVATWKPSLMKYKEMKQADAATIQKAKDAQDEAKAEAAQKAEEQRQQAEKQQQEEVQRLQEQVDRQEAVRKAHISMHEGAGKVNG